MLKPKSITMRSARAAVSAVSPFISLIIDYVCAQPYPRFVTADWATSLDEAVLNELNKLTLHAVKEIHGSRAREAMELALMAMFAERHPALVIAGHQVIRAAGGCAPEDLSPTEARKAIGTFAFILHAEVGRRMGIVTNAPRSMFAVSPDMTYRREPTAVNQGLSNSQRRCGAFIH